MDARKLVRAGVGLVLGPALTLFAACAGDGPTNPTGTGPTLTDITPGSGAAGARARTVRVSLTGAGFDAARLRVSVSGSRVEVTNVSVYDDTYLSADFIIAGGTPTGDRSVTVSTEAGTSEGVRFRVGRDRAGAETHVIEMYDNYPAPTYLKIEAGGSVLWQNVGQNEHTVSTYGTPDEWQSSIVAPGTSFYHTFYEPGEYGFICAFHQEIGFVTVLEPGTTMDMDMMDSDTMMGP